MWNSTPGRGEELPQGCWRTNTEFSSLCGGHGSQQSPKNIIVIGPAPATIHFSMKLSAWAERYGIALVLTSGTRESIREQASGWGRGGLGWPEMGCPGAGMTSESWGLNSCISHPPVLGFFPSLGDPEQEQQDWLFYWLPPNLFI